MAVLEAKAKAAKSGDLSATGAFVDEIFAQSLAPTAAESIRRRISQTEHAFQHGAHQGVSEKAFVQAVNACVALFDGPNYARTSGAQLHEFRRLLGGMMPSVGTLSTSSTTMSPAEALFVASQLATQKIFNPEYQIDPNDWATGVARRRAALKNGDLPEPVPNTNGPALRVERTTSEQAGILRGLRDDLSSENTAITGAAHAFLDQLGFAK
jgi:hypothetical protein